MNVLPPSDPDGKPRKRRKHKPRAQMSARAKLTRNIANHRRLARRRARLAAEALLVDQP